MLLNRTGPTPGVPLWLKPENMDYAFEHLGTVLLKSAASSMRFDFPTSYRVLFLDVSILKDGTAGTIIVRLNNDSGTNYDYQDLAGDSTTVNGARATGQTSIVLTTGETIDDGTSAIFRLVIAKQLAGAKGLVVNAGSYYHTTTPAINVEHTAGIWGNTSDLMSRLDVVAGATNFAAGSVATLYGVRTA